MKYYIDRRHFHDIMHAAHTSNALWFLLSLEMRFDQVVLVYLTILFLFIFYLLLFCAPCVLFSEGGRVVEAVMYGLLLTAIANRMHCLCQKKKKKEKKTEHWKVGWGKEIKERKYTARCHFIIKLHNWPLNQNSYNTKKGAILLQQKCRLRTSAGLEMVILWGFKPKSTFPYLQVVTKWMINWRPCFLHSDEINDSSAKHWLQCRFRYIYIYIHTFTLLSNDYN